MKDFVKRLRWVPFAALAVFALSVVPAKSDFMFSLKGCELLPTAKQFAATFTNDRHLISYFVLFLSAAVCFGRNGLLAAIISTSVVTILVELEQALMVDGHCRAWDLIPNAMAIAMGVAVYLLAGRVWQRRTM